MTNKLSDNLLLFKESIKSRLADNFLARRNHAVISLAQRIAQRAGAKKIERIIDGKPKSYVIVADNMVIRIPLDDLTAARYRLNKVMLKELARTKIAAFIPHFIEEGAMGEHTYFCEERLPGFGLDVPLSKMDEMAKKAADFITRFHRETAQEVVLNEKNFRRLISRLFNGLSKHLNNEYREKLTKIEKGIKKQLSGRPFITVWQHGDYKIENVLFDTADWKIKGIIDWDLAEKEGLPLLDIFYLLIYKANLQDKTGIANIFKTRFLKSRFSASENAIIDNYLRRLGLGRDLIKPLLVVFWLHHITVRYYQKLINYTTSDKGWFEDNIYSVLDALLPQ